MKKGMMMTLGVAIWHVLILSTSWAADNGTVTVNYNVYPNLHNMVVMKDASCLGKLPWSDAKARVASLASGQCGLSDGSTAGQWRLPTSDELLYIAYNAKGSLSAVQSDYWSSTEMMGYSTYATAVSFTYNQKAPDIKSRPNNIIAVR
jgi:hypothetical protein